MPSAKAREGDLGSVKRSDRRFILGILLLTLVGSSLSFSSNVLRLLVLLLDNFMLQFGSEFQYLTVFVFLISQTKVV